MDSEVQEVAEKFFFDRRAEGKRASAADCCDLIRSLMDDKTGYYRFPLAICPSEKALTSAFGNWEHKRLRPIAKASRSRGRPKKNVPPKPVVAQKGQKRRIEEVEQERKTPGKENEKSDEGGMEEEEEDEEEELEKTDDDGIMMAMVEDLLDEIFSP